MNTQAIILPKNKFDVVTLIDQIISRHTIEGSFSPLEEQDLDTLKDLMALNTIDWQKKESTELKRNKSYRIIMDSSRVIGASLKVLSQLKTKLLKSTNGNRDELTKWGFYVL